MISCECCKKTFSRGQSLDRHYTSKLHEIGYVQDIGYVMTVQLGEDNIYRVTDVSSNIIKASWIIQNDISKILNHTLAEVFIDAKVNNSVQLLLRRHQSIYTSSSAANSRGFQLLPVLCKGNHIQVENTDSLKIKNIN